ncbi:MAG TPA: hypothetical protein P5561_03490 [Candidatus Omnitrophota bacterium]|nr:hypothetical protein [Candidatus Omnitrophota bacterium]HRY85577.1 hypothetical protein [Candidatus Omnitrophota bacterium]
MRMIFKPLFASLVLSLIFSPVAGAQTAEALPDLADFAAPEGIGKVQERFGGGSPRIIIQIQDVHAHMIAQQNIAALLERLRTVFGVEKAALEGAWSSTSLPKSHAIPTSREKMLLANALLEDDRISGPVHAAIMSPEPIMLIGMEDAALYEKNRQLFLAHLQKEPEIRQKLLDYGASLKNSQGSVWGPELQNFGKAFGEFRETSDLGKFFPLLLKTAESIGAIYSDLDQIALLQEIMTEEKSVSKERLEAEVRDLMQKYKNSSWNLEELVRGGKIPEEKMLLYPEIKKLNRIYQLQDRISLEDLMSQIEILTGRVLEKLIKTTEEQALWDKTERFYLAERLLLLKAMPKDLKIYENEKIALEPELAGIGLAEELVLSLDFYDTVKKRDDIFFEKIMNDPALAGNIAVVTGGFHTDGLSQKFRESGISYITVAPDLGGASMNEKLYAQRMGGPLRDPVSTGLRPGLDRVKDQTLSELRNALEWFDDRFQASYGVLLATNDVRKAVAAFTGNSPLSQTATRRAALPATTFDETSFKLLGGAEQLRIVRGWFERIQGVHGKAMLVSQVSILKRLLEDEKVPGLIEGIVKSNDFLVLVQDVPLAEVPEIFLASRGIERFEVEDLDTLMNQTPKFQRFAKKFPFAIMKEGYKSGVYVVLPERPISLVLYRIIALNPNLYQSAKNPEFLALLENLVSEMLSQELPEKAA